jgi:hypothetical protein
MSMLDALLGTKILQNDGVSVPVRQELNFVGDGVLVADNPVTRKTDITVLSGATGVLVTALFTLIGTADRVQIACDGYLARGDGGGGTFVWDSSSTATSDGGTIFGSAPTGRWRRVFDGSIVDPAWFGAVASASPSARLAAIQTCVASLSTYSGIDFGARTYDLGTRTGAADAPLQIYLNGLQSKTLHSRGATFAWQTTHQVNGYFPVLFRINNCKRLSFEGSWSFADTKSWSLYDSHGASGVVLSEGWSGLSGMLPIAVQDGCEDLRFGHMRFGGTAYGISVSGIFGALPVTRSRRISIDSLHADDVLYPLLCAENGDDLSCPQLSTFGCGRPFFVYGCSGVKISANIRESINQLSSSIARKSLDTANIEVDMRYTSGNGYPVTPLSIQLSPSPSTGTPLIDSVKARLTCAITTVDAAREQQYAVKMLTYTTAGAETTYGGASGEFRGIDLDIDKGKFSLYLNGSPESDSTTPLEKIPVNLTTRVHRGGAFNAPLSSVDGSAYATARKFSLHVPPYYEFVSSDTVHSPSYAFPTPGWGPWQNSALVNVPLAGHTVYWKWIRTGALVHYELFIRFGAGGALPGNAWFFRLPYSPDYMGEANPPRGELGRVELFDSSTSNWYFGQLGLNGSSDVPTVDIHQSVVGGVSAIVYLSMTATSPVAIAAGDSLRIVCDYAAYRAI